MKSRSHYQQSIWTYEQRRMILKEKYGHGSGKTKKITVKISTWKSQIRRIDKRANLLKSIIKMINEFYGVNICSGRMDTRHKLARKVYYKYAIEKGISGVFVNQAVKRINVHTATDSRLKFTRSFKTNKYHKEQYHKFINSIS